MAGSMSLADLAQDLRGSMHDSASLFDAEDDADFKRLLLLALPDMGWKRPTTRLGQVTLIAGEARYALSAYPDFANYKTHLWQEGPAYPRPWEPGYPGALPRVAALRDGVGGVGGVGGAAWLVFEPAPSALHIAYRGSAFKFYYFAQHSLGVAAADTTVAAQDRGLLLLRAQAQAMLELVLHQSNKPVALRDGVSGTPRNSTPAALHEMLLRLFQEAR